MEELNSFPVGDALNSHSEDKIGISEHNIPFQQVLLEECFELSNNKPNIKIITGASGLVKLLEQYVISSPKHLSLEGQQLSGCNLMIHALFELSMEYICDSPNQTIHCMIYEVPFSSCIVLPEQVRIYSNFHLTAEIPSIRCEKMDCRNFIACSTIILTAFP